MNYQQEQQELNKFFEYYYSLANCRVPWAQSWIADAYFWGWGVQSNYGKFVEWDTKAARNGSVVSARRMLLYYHSIGSKEASATLCTMKFNNPINNVLEFSKICNIDDYLKLYGNKTTLEMIEEYSNAIDIDELHRNDYIGWRKECALLLKPICYIYGFGVEQNFQQAMSEIIKNDVPEENEKFWGIDHSVVHYYCCLREFDVAGDETFDRNIRDKSPYRFGFFHENEEDAYKLRHYIRWSLTGNAEASGYIGVELLEKKNRVDNERRRLFYHNDMDAMFYLSKAAGVKPNSFSTYEAIELSTNPDLNTFNFEYGKNLCLRVESQIDDVSEKDGEYEAFDKSIIRRCLAEGFADLARGTMDENEKRDFGNRGLNQCQKYMNENDGDEESFQLGKIYFECFHDYNTALMYFNKCDDPNDHVKKYIWACKKNGARM